MSMLMRRAFIGSNAVSDPYFSNVSLLLSFNGANGSTSATDRSQFANATTFNGDAEISTSQSKFGGSSLYLDGTSDYVAIGNSTAFDFGAGDFTVEAWIYLAGNSAKDAGGDRGCTIANTWDNSAPISGWLFAITGNATTTGTGLSFDSWGPSTTRSSASQSVSISQGVWHHVAAVVYGGVRSLYLDGTKYTPTMQYLNGGYDACNSQGKPLRVGTTGNAGYPLALNGYIDELRITKGVGRYTSSFTVQTSEFPAG